MKISKPTKIDALFWNSFEPDHSWYVPDEWQQELYNYIVLGLRPGSFHSAVYAGDLMGAATHSHALNTWPAIVGTCKWLINVAPPQSWGSYESVDAWLKLSNKERTKILIDHGLSSTEKEVSWNILSSSE